MTQKTSAICYGIAGLCFLISGGAGFAAGRMGYAVIRIILGAALLFLAYMNIKMYRKAQADQAVTDAGINPEEFNAAVTEEPGVGIDAESSTVIEEEPAAVIEEEPAEPQQ